MPPNTPRTLNSLPFEPKRFEGLVQQLPYEFRPWRQLEATGRTGSDDGFDAQGFEIVAGGEVIPEEGEEATEAGPRIVTREPSALARLHTLAQLGHQVLETCSGSGAYASA